MASLTGNLVAETYKALLKTIDNDILTASEKQITDGFGGGSNIFIDSQGFIRANKYKVTNGLATQFLKADGSLDANTYLTSITGAQVITALGYTPVTDQRTLTINGVTYNLTANRSWTVAGTAAVWGNITGTLSDQTDLQNALNAKYDDPTGTISQYIRGDGSIANFPAVTGFVPYTGATEDVDLGDFALFAHDLEIDHGSSSGTAVNIIKGGSGIAVNITKTGSGEALTVVKSSGSGNAASITGGVTLISELHLTTDLADAYIASAATWNAKQNALSGTGFVKISGTTISYDNSTYLTTADAASTYLTQTTAASTYQRLDKMVSNLLPSSTEYPNSNAVINALALKADAANPVFTGFMTISGAEPRLYFVDTDNNPDYTIFIDSGIFYIYDQTAGATRFSIGTTGNINAGIGKSITAGSFIKDGGTASQFLKADGSIDSNTYVSSSALADYLLISTATATYQRLDKMVSNLLPSSTEYPNSNAVINALALKANAANPVFTGNFTISGSEPRITFTDTDNDPDYFIGVDGGFFRIFDQAANITRFVINSSGNITTGINNTITSWGFVKSGGTSSQYLMADGSVSTLSGLVTGSGTTNNLPKWTSGSTLGNSIISDNGTNVAIAGNLQSARFYNTFVNSSNNSRNSFQSFNLNESSLTVGWIAADFGDTGTTSNRVVFGSGYGGKAIIGGHTGLLDNWASLLINPSGFGNVIIGATTDAGFKLDVNGTGRFSGSVQSQSINVIAGSTSGFSFAVDQQSTFAFGSTNGKRVAIIRDSSVGDNGLQFGYDTTDKTGIIAGSATSVGAGIDFYTFNGSSWGNRMRITSGGNVGIGTTASSYKFDVQNGSDFDIRLRDTSLGGTVGILFETANDFSGTSQAYIKGIGAGNSGVSQLIFGTAGSSGDTTATERMRITSAGNVGIGTTSPQDYSGFNVLHINGKSGSSGGVLRLTAFDNSSSANIYAAGSAINFNTTSAVPFIWYTQDSERMRITSGGNVLIGTSTDSGYKLLTNGNFAISTGSFFGVYGSIAASWSGSTIYPTLYSNAADRWIMHINPHISYTQNGVNGFTGSMLGATVRFASSPAAATFWDLGVGICNIGADNFGIGRAGTIFFRIANNAAAFFGFSVTATGFFESSDFRLKKLIEHNPIVAGIENLQAKLYEKNGKIELGYFAQDAELIMPYAVTKNMDGFLNLSYREIHTAKIARLEQRVAELEKQLNLN